MVRGLLIFFFISQALFLTGQSFIPTEFLWAVEAGTRTLEGFPGSLYYQNSSSYRITVKFNPLTGYLSGVADIEYFNNKPDTLRTIVMRLYQNLYKKGSPVDYVVNPDILHDGVNITNLSIDNKNITSALGKRTRTEGTLFTIFLVDPLKPSGSSKIHIEWNFVMPQTKVNRYGKYAPGTYFVAFWYPQISVNDDIWGWDQTFHTGTHEFYNDFNSYHVTIKVPNGYMVWATGKWMNAEDILQDDILDRYKEAGASDNVVNIITAEDLKVKSIFKSKGEKQFIFTAEQVPDFAFGVSDKYLWDAASVRIDSTQSERVLVQSAYMPHAPNFELVAELGTEIIRRLSTDTYGIIYPYNTVTVFQGEGAMEYPMMVNNGASYSRNGTLFVTMHEVAHAYFPFLTGINETKYGWMDEGLTSFLPMETELAMESNFNTLEEVNRHYEMFSRTENDLPLMVPSWQTREQTYYFLSYFKAVVAFAMLEDFMGKDNFRKGIQEFVRTWEYKHPTPYDFFNIMKRHTSRESDWFIDAWFFQSGWPDLALGDITMSGNNLKIEVIKKGALPVPVFLQINYKSIGSDTIYYHPEVWQNESTISITKAIFDEVESVRLGNEIIPDKDDRNNIRKFEDSKE